MSNLISPHDRSRLQAHSQDVAQQDVAEQDVAEHDSLDNAEVEQLRKENAELKVRVEEMEQAGLDSQREYENLLEEKSEVIRGLHQKIQELQGSGTGTGTGPRETAQEDELLSIQKELEVERQRLQQDEESLMVQMREMELSMAKERAELARQRTELQRLQAELNREVELASRDADLRDRLNALQRRQQATLQHRHDTADKAGKNAGPSDATPLPKKTNSGLFGRLFGK
jgi:hypothetical protein